VRVEAGAIETLSLRQAGSQAPARFSPDWPVRAVVRVFHLEAADLETALVMADLRPTLGRWLKLRPGAPWRVVDAATGVEVGSGIRLDDNLLFSARLPARSLLEFHVYLRPEAQETPSAALTAYERLLSSPANLVPNPSLEQGGALPTGWTFGDEQSRAAFQAGRRREGLFGEYAVGFQVASNQPTGWVGWRSGEVRVRPGSWYLLAGYLKALGLDGVAALHGHWHTREGQLASASPFLSTHPGISAESSWERSSALIQAPPDAASLQIHLTMNAHGGLMHDGLLLCEVRRGEVTRLETAACLAGETNAVADALRVAEVNPLIKVFRDDPPAPPAERVQVECARNEFEPFQLVARAGQPLKNLRVAVSALRHGSGATLPPVRIERVGYVPVDHPSGYYTSKARDWERRLPLGAGATDGWMGLWPDPLLPEASCDLGAAQNQPFWFTVHAPPQSPPGDYRGQIEFQAEGVPVQAIPLAVRVLPFSLPARTRLAAIFDFRFGPGGQFGEASSKEERRRWLRFMAERRLAIDAIQPAPVFKREGGKVTMDAAAFDEEARFCFDELGMNTCYTPWFFYMFGWAYPPKKLFGLEPFSEDWTQAFKECLSLFAGHLQERGWRERFVYYISDEPHFQHPFVVDQMKRLCALIHSVEPRLPIYSSTWRPCPAWEESLDIWGVGQFGCFPVAGLERLRQAGRQFWFTCDGQMALDTPYAATERMLPYYCHRYGATGFEFWGISWWTANPWQRGWHDFIRQSDEGKTHYWIRYPNGDGYLIYPGSLIGQRGPLSTIRLEQIREGLEDHEAIRLLEERVRKAVVAGRDAEAGQRALALCRELAVIPNAGGLRSTGILPDPDRIPALRKAVNAALVQLAE